MGRGGLRPGSGRRPILSRPQRFEIAQWCERLSGKIALEQAAAIALRKNDLAFQYISYRDELLTQKDSAPITRPKFRTFSTYEAAKLEQKRQAVRRWPKITINRLFKSRSEENESQDSMSLRDAINVEASKRFTLTFNVPISARNVEGWRKEYQRHLKNVDEKLQKLGF